jgi:uncharacterized membrane protein
MNTINIQTNKKNMGTQQLILIATATATALIAGLFYAYSCSVNIALSKLSDEGYVAVMQSINREIQNPLFFTSFMGTLFLLPLSTWMQYRVGVSPTFFLLLAATAIYIIGAFIVTMAGNVPLNEALDKFNFQAAASEEITRQRIQFENVWNRWHTIRTVCSFVSLVLVLIALSFGQDAVKMK